ncbi:MAG TPA: peptidoglycan DD-metalloendopeptidase family protein [Thermoanaerobaculia bacterium]|jgi:septal ring factor EnvC (AmiA/AmiB activator)|nr:peptidoglycan DD-metalloendopeptidase family protein [Thermoanaerobaculia bacterium]
MRRLVALVFLALLALPTPGQEPTPARERERELQEIRARISTLRGRLSEVRKQQTGLAGELAAADLGLELQRERLAEAVAARDLAARRETEIATEVARLETELAASKLALERRLAGLYRFGRQGYLRLILTLHPDNRLLPSVRLLRFLARRDAQAVERYGASKVALSAERERLVAERKASEIWVGREELRRRELVSLRNRRAELLARSEREGKSLAAEARALTEKGRKLANLIDLLYGRNQGGSPLGAPIQQLRGLLDWPVRGQVKVGFGPRLDPRYRTQVPHNGLDLATEPGSEVRAIYPGKVLYAAPFQGYGWTVVLQHPGQVLSLAAGMSSLRVGPGDMVSLGQTVGLSTEALYFEIRAENRPEDPMSWLRSTRSP